MSQFGMQMPGGRGARTASPNAYTAILFFAVVSLALATAMMWQAGTKVAKPGGAMAPLMGIQDPPTRSTPIQLP
jgi:hypothetical protein